MIEEYLKYKNKDKESNTYSSLESTEQETIKSVIYLDEETKLILFQSNTSLILFSDGAFQILNIESTDKILKDFKSQNELINKSVQKLKEIDKNGNKSRNDSQKEI